MKATVRELGGGRFFIQIRGQLPGGVQIRERYRREFYDKKAATNWTNMRIGKLWSGEAEPNDADKSIPTVAEFAPEWMNKHARANEHKPRGIDHKEVMLKAHIIPALGHLRLDEVTLLVVQKFKLELQRKKAWRRNTTLGKKSINNVLTVLGQMLKSATEWEIIPRAPVVKMLRRQTPTMQFHDQDTWQELIDSAARVGPKATAVMRLMGDGGLRLSEMIGLLWSDVNFEAGGMMLQRSDSDGELIDLKGNESRWVPFTDELRAALKALPRRKGQTRVLVRKNGQSYTKKAIYYLLGKIKKGVGRPLPGLAHIMRHTVASHMVSAGVPLYFVQLWLGHKDPKTTMRYAHLAPSALSGAVEALKAYRGQQAGTPKALNEKKSKGG